MNKPVLSARQIGKTFTGGGLDVSVLAGIDLGDDEGLVTPHLESRAARRAEERLPHVAMSALVAEDRHRIVSPP